MKIEPVTTVDGIKKGDLLLISDGKEVIAATAKIVKVSEHDGTEIIYNIRKNKYFNLGMYLQGRSWAKEVQIVRAA